MDGTTPPRTIQSTGTAFDIIELLKSRGSAGVTDMSSELELAKSTVHGHLATLERRGYVVKNGGSYRLGLRFLDLGANVKRSYEVLEVVRPKMERLAVETDERTQFMVVEHGYGFYLHRAEGVRAVPTDSQIGKPRHLHTCSTGKALLAAMPRDQVERIIERHGLPAKTTNTITDTDDLYRALTNIRERGYAFNRSESVEGLWAIGATVERPDGTAIGALSVSGPAHRMNEENRIEDVLPNKLLGTIEEIELNISYS